jgi:hypothetical protein
MLSGLRNEDRQTGLFDFVRCSATCVVDRFVLPRQAGAKMDTVIGAVPKTTLVQTLDKYVD